MYRFSISISTLASSNVVRRRRQTVIFLLSIFIGVVKIPVAISSHHQTAAMPDWFGHSGIMNDAAGVPVLPAFTDRIRAQNCFFPSSSYLQNYSQL